ncbi:MAG: helix-turn-helix domain-containing protein [Woeseiaceae bacterium]|jgi:hypothetical protein|nr:helix-turn-helix domain-containing protein [Woeseiaceae bacterium]
MRLDHDFFDRHFGDLWPIHNRGFTALLVECRRLFDGDLDQALILSVIGERTLTKDRASGLRYQEFVDGVRRSGKRKPINIQSIADGTGIPRETVRRKIGLLVERGWVRRNDDETIEVTESAPVDLAPATSATFEYLSAIGNAIVARASDAPAGPARGKGGAGPKT